MDSEKFNKFVKEVMLEFAVGDKSYQIRTLIMTMKSIQYTSSLLRNHRMGIHDLDRDKGRVVIMHSISTFSSVVV